MLPKTLVYRIVIEKYAHNLYASGLPGRWNQRGELVIYTAASAEIALLENMAHRMGQGGLMQQGFVCLEIEVPETSQLTIDHSELPSDWGSASSYRLTSEIGSQWYQAREHLVLKVPSAPAPTGVNWVLNTTHSLFREVTIRKSYPYPIDHRFTKLDRDLTRYLTRKK